MFVAMPYAIKEAGFGLGILLVLVVTAVTGINSLVIYTLPNAYSQRKLQLLKSELMFNR